MILTKQHYKEYLEADRMALQIPASKSNSLKQYLNPDYIWTFQKKLRKLEYYKNCKSGYLNNLYYSYLRFQFKKYSLRLGFTIPENVFGKGLAIVHYGSIVVSTEAKVGKNCRLHPSTTIGASGGKEAAPKIGNNVYIGPGARIFGDIEIANNTAISANATVNKSFTEENTMLAGSPATRIKNIDITQLIANIEIKQ